MNTTEVTAPTPATIETLRTDLVGRVRPALEAVWPADVPLQSFDVVLTPANIELNLHYQASKDLDPITLDFLQKTLQDRLNAPTLTVNAQRIAVPPPAKGVVNSRQRLTNKK